MMEIIVGVVIIVGWVIGMGALVRAAYIRAGFTGWPGIGPLAVAMFETLARGVQTAITGPRHQPAIDPGPTFKSVEAAVRWGERLAQHEWAQEHPDERCTGRWVDRRCILAAGHDGNHQLRDLDWDPAATARPGPWGYSRGGLTGREAGEALKAAFYAPGEQKTVADQPPPKPPTPRFAPGEVDRLTSTCTNCDWTEINAMHGTVAVHRTCCYDHTGEPDVYTPKP